MRAVAIVCSLIVLGMIGMSVKSYVNFHASENDSSTQVLDVSPLLDGSIDTVDHEWCNDEAYVDSVVIPMQEEKYNFNMNSVGMDSLHRHLVCVDSDACDLHDSMYDKSNQARDITIQLIEINTKLDSLEKDY